MDTQEMAHDSEVSGYIALNIGFVVIGLCLAVVANMQCPEELPIKYVNMVCGYMLFSTIPIGISRATTSRTVSAFSKALFLASFFIGLCWYIAAMQWYSDPGYELMMRYRHQLTYGLLGVLFGWVIALFGAFTLSGIIIPNRPKS